MLKISFDFNETSKTVSNVKVTEIETGKTRGVVANSKPNIDDNGPDLQVLENKLQLSKKALLKLNAKADDRISIQYINDGIGKATPIIGKAEIFTDRLDGNRLSQKGTIAFRGEKRTTLIEFGTLFNLEEYKDGIWKLIPFENSDEDETLSQEQSDVDALNDSEIDKEIEEIMSSNVDDDLPF
jgi:hypothetical protein